MKNSEIDKIVLSRVNSKIEELKQLSVEQLLELPPYTRVDFDAGGKKQELFVYHETLENSEALIVAQCKNTQFLGIGNIYAQGFLLKSSGEIAEAPEELMWDFT